MFFFLIIIFDEFSVTRIFKITKFIYEICLCTENEILKKNLHGSVMKIRTGINLCGCRWPYWGGWKYRYDHMSWLFAIEQWAEADINKTESGSKYGSWWFFLILWRDAQPFLMRKCKDGPTLSSSHHLWKRFHSSWFSHFVFSLWSLAVQNQPSRPSFNCFRLTLNSRTGDIAGQLMHTQIDI